MRLMSIVCLLTVKTTYSQGVLLTVAASAESIKISYRLLFNSRYIAGVILADLLKTR